MAGYEDTRQKIISTLMGRPNGTEIQPENHQDYALNMLDYIRGLELIATSTLIGIAEQNTTPVQPNSSRVCYIAGVAQNQTVTFQNFIDENGNPISVTTGDMEGVFIILLWNTQYWSAQTFSTNIISHSESATFYYRYNIRKTYASIALMNADVESPIGTDGKYIKVGDIVTVVNSTTPSENGIYSYEGATDGWKYQSSFNFQLVQTTGTDVNSAMSQKAVTDNLELKIDKTSIKQVLGTSTTDIMSQKAVTETLDQQFVKSVPSGDSDLDIVDKSGFCLAKFENGHFKTKNFDSEKIKNLPILKNNINYDLAFVDLNGNTILALLEGHIKTKNFDSRKVQPSLIENAFDYKWAGYLSYSDMIPVTVKKDGTGDFTTIQEAINSITDASPMKQYDIQVYDDFYCNQTTDLWQMSNPTQRATANPTSFVCYVLTKDYVHIRGVGERKTISVESPLDLAGASFQNIHNLYARGKCIINNFNFVIKGGRYASHGDDSGSHEKGTNAFATQMIINCRFEHKGNYMYSNGTAWGAICASTDICLSSGSHRIFINDTFISPGTPIYGHNMAYHEYPAKVTMIKCSTINNSNGIAVPSMYDIGCGHKTEVELINCDFSDFLFLYDGIYSTSPNRGVLNKATNGGFRVHGFGNRIAPYIDMTENCWFIKAKDNNKDLEVIGGTAYDDIWVATQKLYKGVLNAPGVSVSEARIVGTRADNVNYAFTLAYRLGNCATTNKTLIVKVDGVEYTIVFNKNYMTSDGSAYTNQTIPNISDADIIADINAAEPSVFECALGLPYNNKESYDDCKETGLNFSSEVLLPGDCVRRDVFCSNRWLKVGANEKVEGVVAERIDGSFNDEGVTKYNEGRILKLNKVLFYAGFIGAPAGAAGDMYKNGINGWEITTDISEAQLIHIGGNLLKSINN